jgi:hypothetical protein
MDGIFGPELVPAVNAFMGPVKKSGGVCTVIVFGSEAGIVYERDNKRIAEGSVPEVGAGTDFRKAIGLELEVVRRNRPIYKPIIYFFTDGHASIPTRECDEVAAAGADIYAVGYGQFNRTALATICRGRGGLTAVQAGAPNGLATAWAMLSETTVLPFGGGAWGA